jgi:hypothetical protein
MATPRGSWDVDYVRCDQCDNCVSISTTPNDESNSWPAAYKTYHKCVVFDMKLTLSRYHDTQSSCDRFVPNDDLCFLEA